MLHVNELQPERNSYETEVWRKFDRWLYLIFDVSIFWVISKVEQMTTGTCTQQLYQWISKRNIRMMSYSPPTRLKIPLYQCIKLEKQYFIFFQVGTVMISTIWLVLSAVRIYISLPTVTVTLARIFSVIFFFSFESLEKKKKLFTGLGSVRIVKYCDLGVGNAAQGLWPWATFSRPQSQFFTIWTSQSANKIYIYE